jgi:hypothetical protein
MSALGHKQTYAVQNIMSALPLKADMCSAARDVCFGSKADVRTAISNVRFTPNSDRESGFPKKFMSALPPKADTCSALSDVRFGPIADMACLFDHLIGSVEQTKWNGEAQRSGRLEIDH